jgi:predicted nucleic acid-binding protein
MPSAKMNCFVDTNVLLYAQDARVPEKKKRAAEWIDALADKGLAVISPQVMNEFARNILRKFRHINVDQLLQELELMIPLCQAPTTADTAINGLLIYQRYKLSFYDAVLIASAISAECGIFLSEDLSHHQAIGALKIVNPFLIAPRDLL